MRWRQLRARLVPVAASLVLCACSAAGPRSTSVAGSGSPAGSTSAAGSIGTRRATGTPTGRRTPARRHRTGSPPRTGSPTAAHPRRVGHTQRVRAPGTTLLVTVTSVIDPLRNAGASVPPGETAVGVLVSVRNSGPAGYDSSATGDFALLTASGAAPPAFVARGTCQTQLRDFMNAVGAGELRTGCVSYAIPAGQRPIVVRFSPDGGRAGDRVSWALG